MPKKDSTEEQIRMIKANDCILRPGTKFHVVESRCKTLTVGTTGFMSRVSGASKIVSCLFLSTIIIKRGKKGIDRLEERGITVPATNMYKLLEGKKERTAHFPEESSARGLVIIEPLDNVPREVNSMTELEILGWASAYCLFLNQMATSTVPNTWPKEDQNILNQTIRSIINVPMSGLSSIIESPFMEDLTQNICEEMRRTEASLMKAIKTYEVSVISQKARVIGNMYSEAGKIKFGITRSAMEHAFNELEEKRRSITRKFKLGSRR